MMTEAWSASRTSPQMTNCPTTVSDSEARLHVNGLIFTSRRESFGHNSDCPSAMEPKEKAMSACAAFDAKLQFSEGSQKNAAFSLKPIQLF
jgi:hypothetical protein